MMLLLSLLLASLVPSSAVAKTQPTAKTASALVPSKNAYKSAKTTALNPVPQKQLNTILSYREFMTLSKENQEAYVSEIQSLMLDLQKQDEALKTSYQTARHWLSALISDAVAADGEDRPCVYAGWISSMDINGRACLRPKSDGCLRGQIQCNPMLYGSGRCVAANRSATASCERSKKPISQVVSEIHGHEQEWSNMREELSNYCNDPRPTQGKVCAIIRNRLARLERVIGDVPPPKYEAESSSASSGVLVAPAKPSTSGGTTGSTAGRAPVSAQPPPQADIKITRSSGSCNPATLLANMRPGSTRELGSSTFMDLESARTLMCSTDPIPGDWVSGQRQLIAKTLTYVRGNDKYARHDRINYQYILGNFNACLKDAETLRRTGAGSVTGAFATVVLDGQFVKMYDANNRPLVGLGSRYDLEGLLRADGISICNIRTRDGVQMAPVYSHSNSGSAAPAGSAE
jgi:hypothetical protein